MGELMRGRASQSDGPIDGTRLRCDAEISASLDVARPRTHNLLIARDLTMGTGWMSVVPGLRVTPRRLPERVETFSRTRARCVDGTQGSATAVAILGPMATPARTVGKTPGMAFVLEYLREFPGADYQLVRKAALARGLAAPAPILYGNALRVLRTESARNAQPEGAPAPQRGARRRRRDGQRIEDLAGLIQEMKSVAADRDRLRDAVEQIAAVLKQLRR